jgi:hypothetical protein
MNANQKEGQLAEHYMKPIIILPPKTVSAEDIKALRDNGICVVEAKNPAAVKFVDPIPAASCRTAIEDAAIKLSRKLLHGELVGHDYKKNIAALYVDLLVEGTPLSAQPTQAEREKKFFDQEKLEELRKLARQEAKAERDAAKTTKVMP